MTTADTRIHEPVSGKRIAEILFHGGDWKTDREIRQVITRAVSENEPDAILLNLTDFRYHGGDYASGFLVAFFDDQRRVKRPACFLGAPPQLKPLFNKVDPTGVFGVRYFDDHNDALRYLTSRLGQGD